MKRCCPIFIALSLLGSCHTSKETVIATDVQTQKTMLPQSYVMPKGKTCFVTTTTYPIYLPGNNSFNKQTSTFVYSSKGIEISSPKSEESVIDTVIQNSSLTSFALEYAVNKLKLPECEYIPDYEYRNKDNELELLQIISERKPEVIINLKELSFHVSGKSKTMAYILSTIPNRIYNQDPLYPKNEVSGDLQMTYSAVWEVIKANDMERLKTIQLQGKKKVPFYQGFDLSEELKNYAIEAGEDFPRFIRQ